MPNLNWGMIQDGGAFESLMHALLYAEYPDTILFGRPGPDQGQDARSSDGCTVYQAKYRQNLDMDGAIAIALKELDQIKKYRQPAQTDGFWHPMSSRIQTTTRNGSAKLSHRSPQRASSRPIGHEPTSTTSSSPTQRLPPFFSMGRTVSLSD